MKATSLMVLVQFGGNEELLESCLFKSELKGLTGKTLQLSVAPKLDKSRLILGFTLASQRGQQKRPKNVWKSYEAEEIL